MVILVVNVMFLCRLMDKRCWVICCFIKFMDMFFRLFKLVKICLLMFMFS